MKVVIFGGLIALALYAGLSLEAWRWSECRMVGHGVAYCIMEAGR